MFKKIERCQYGHVNAEKKRLLFLSILMVLIGVGIFVLGLALNKWSKSNIFTVIAVLFVLPMARYLTTLIILLPFQTPKKSFYEEVKKAMPEKAELFSDYVFTLSEKVYGLDFLVITAHELIGVSLRQKEKREKTTAVLTEGLKKRAFSGKVTILTNEGEFLQKLSRTETEGLETGNAERLEFLKSLAV